MPNDNSLLEKIYNKVEALDSRMDGMDKVLVRQEENLKEHMRRSQAAEDGIDVLKGAINSIHKEEIQPIKDDILVVKKVGKGILYLMFGSGLLFWVLDKLIK